MSSVWLAITLAGILTFLTRFSFISIAGKWSPSPAFRHGLRFVPVAVLAAIIMPEIFMLQGKFNSSPLNPRLLAAVFALIVAHRSRNTIITIITGMVIFWLVSAIHTYPLP